jgi:hypothetical protein
MEPLLTFGTIDCDLTLPWMLRCLDRMQKTSKTEGKQPPENLT